MVLQQRLEDGKVEYPNFLAAEKTMEVNRPQKKWGRRKNLALSTKASQ